uniref:Uncharacterized protein n=1 Tax=viral metagenome TaxID=1070528 RepID=A0A6C0E720_9ZZZZ
MFSLNYSNTDEISLRPCKGSLQNLISIHGSNYHKSQEFLSAKQKSDEKYEQRKNDLINYLYENDIDIKVTTEMIYSWDGSEAIKEKINHYWKNYYSSDDENIKNIKNINNELHNSLNNSLDTTNVLPMGESDVERTDMHLNYEDKIDSDDGFEIVASKKKKTSHKNITFSKNVVDNDVDDDVDDE